MKNKVTVIVLAIVAGVIWTFIAITLSDTNVKKAASDVVPVVERPVDTSLKSLSMSPFMLPEVRPVIEKIRPSPVRVRKTNLKKWNGRMVGVIGGVASMSVVVELDGKYHHLCKNMTDGECRMLEIFDDDSVRILYKGDTLMLYGNERIH